MSVAYVRAAAEPELAPPLLTSGPLAWVRANLSRRRPMRR